jgi:hypothetical protein
MLLRSLSNTQNKSEFEKLAYEVLSKFFSIFFILTFFSGFLRRCMTQQAPIRERLYAGLCDIQEAHPSLSEQIFDLLLSQVFPKSINSSFL